MRNASRWMFAGALLLALPLADAAAKGGAKPKGKKGDPAALSDAERNAAIRKAVAYLEGQLFRLPDAQGTPRKQFTVAVTGLVQLMSRKPGVSRVPGKDLLPQIRAYLVRYVDEVERRTADPNQLPGRHGLASSAHLIQYTWPLGVSGLFFGELYLRGWGKGEASKVLKKIVTILEAAQQRNGGWGHGRINTEAGKGKPDPLQERLRKMGFKGGGGYPDTLLASSNCVAPTLGLLSTLRGLGAFKSLPAARTYYQKARLPNGSFPYDPSQRSAGRSMTNVGRTAGALFAEHCLGSPITKDYERSVAYLMGHLKWVPEGHGSPCLNMMHGALACHALGEKPWKRFRDLFEKRIAQAQDDDGGFRCICEQKAFGVTCDNQKMFGGLFGDSQKAYRTALHAFVLLLHRDSLKILDRKRPRAAITPR